MTGVQTCALPIFDAFFHGKKLDLGGAAQSSAKDGTKADAGAAAAQQAAPAQQPAPAAAPAPQTARAAAPTQAPSSGSDPSSALLDYLLGGGG